MKYGKCKKIELKREKVDHTAAYNMTVKSIFDID